MCFFSFLVLCFFFFLQNMKTETNNTFIRGYFLLWINTLEDLQQ